MTKKITTRLTFITWIMWLLKNFANCNNINSVNHLNLMIDEIIGHFVCNSIEEKNKNKYLILDDVDANREVL